MQGGNHHAHGVSEGLRAIKSGPAGKPAALSISSDDAGVAFMGKPWPLPNPVWANSSDITEGAGFLLVDNTWGTNYPAWVPWKSEDANMRWRFTMSAS